MAKPRLAIPAALSSSGSAPGTNAEPMVIHGDTECNPCQSDQN
jgi:hypothetical protein